MIITTRSARNAAPAHLDAQPGEPTAAAPTSGDSTPVPRPRRRWAVAATVALATLGSALLTTSAGSAEASTAATQSSYGSRFAAGYLDPGQSGRYCFDYAHYAYYGPVAVSAESTQYYDVTLTTVSTDVTDRSGTGWVYCATIRNDSSRRSDVTITQRTHLAAFNTGTLRQGYLAPHATGNYCFSAPNRPDPGPVVVTARSSTVGDTLTTVSTNLEHRANYGWVYCASINNASNVGGDVTLDEAIAPASSNAFNLTNMYLGAHQTGTFCVNYPFGVSPTLATGSAYEYGVPLTTLSISRDDPSTNHSVSLWCARIRNDSATPSGLTVQTVAGL